MGLTKLLISADIEGTCGIAHWDEVEARGGAWYEYFREQMTREVVAACQGAQKSGAKEILVKDAHDTGRNIIPTALPAHVRMHRGWDGGLMGMLAGLDEGFDAVAFTGYHSAAGSSASPLSHTMMPMVDEIRINGARVSEFAIYAYAAATLGVPVIFLSGDAGLCREAQALVPGISVVATNWGVGDAVTSLHPHEAADRIREGMEHAVAQGGKHCTVQLPEHFEVLVRYRAHAKAYFYSSYPGAKRLNAQTVQLEANDYTEVLRFFHFVL